MPAQAGTQWLSVVLGSRLRGNDRRKVGRLKRITAPAIQNSQ